MCPTAAWAEPHNLRGLEFLLAAFVAYLIVAVALLVLLVHKRISGARCTLFLLLAFGAWALVLNVPLGNFLPTLIIVALPVPFFLRLGKPG